MLFWFPILIGCCFGLQFWLGGDIDASPIGRPGAEPLVNDPPRHFWAFNSSPLMESMVHRDLYHWPTRFAELLATAK